MSAIQATLQESIKRISLGIEWLDLALQGGVPRGNWLLVTGEPGTGKSVLTIQATGANINKIPVIYISTETKFTDIIKQAKQFNIDLSNAVNLVDIITGKVKEGNLVVIDLFGLAKEYRELLKNEETKAKSPLSMDVVMASIERAYEALGVSEDGKITTDVLVVLDSVTPMWASAPATSRTQMYQLRQRLYRSNVTVIMTSQVASTTKETFGFGIEHIADAIIHMWFEPIESTKEIERWLIIKKARLTNHYRKAIKFEIEHDKGLVLLEPSIEEIRNWIMK